MADDTKCPWCGAKSIYSQEFRDEICAGIKPRPDWNSWECLSIRRSYEEAPRQSDQCVIRQLDSALGNLIKLAEGMETAIDGEFGACRNIEEMERDGDLSKEIIQARAVLRSRA